MSSKKLHNIFLILLIIYLMVTGLLDIGRKAVLLNAIFFLPIIVTLTITLVWRRFGSPIVFTLHIFILLLIFVFLLVSGMTTSTTIVLEKGKTTTNQLLKKAGINSLTLHNFVVKLTRDKRSIKDYGSILILNQKDTVTIKVNKPFSRKNLKIFQKAYRINYYFNLVVNGSNNFLTPGDSLTIDNFKIVFNGYDFKKKEFVVTVNDSIHYIKKNRVCKIEPFHIMITPGFTKYSSVLLITHSKGKNLLLILTMAYILTLTIALIVKK